MELSIAKEKYQFSTGIKSKVSKKKWIEFIEMNSGYFTWLEDTKAGKDTLSTLDKVPESFREGVLKGHFKSQACAEFNAKKKYYEVIVDFIDDYGKVATTIMKPITKAHLRRLLDMANYLDAYLLNNGNEIIDDKFIESH